MWQKKLGEEKPKKKLFVEVKKMMGNAYIYKWFTNNMKVKKNNVK